MAKVGALVTALITRETKERHPDGQVLLLRDGLLLGGRLLLGCWLLLGGGLERGEHTERTALVRVQHLDSLPVLLQVLDVGPAEVDGVRCSMFGVCGISLYYSET